MKLIQFELTKEYILSKVSEYTIFQRYLEITDISLKEQYVNVLRNDDTPNCSFFVRSTDNRLIFNDFAWRQFDCFDVVKQKYRVSFIKALEIVANDFNLLKGVKPSSEGKVVLASKARYSIRIKRKKFNKSDLAFWNIGGLEIDHNTLQKNKIYSIECLWEYVDNDQRFYDNLKTAFAYHFVPDDGYNYQIYMPLKDKHHRRFINPSGIKYGDIEFLNPNEDYVIITKSKKDSFYLRLFGINTCFIINERIRPSDIVPHLLDTMGYSTVFTLFDNDRTGISQSWRYRKEYNTIPLLVEEKGCKDFTDLLKHKGKQYVIDMIEYYKEKLL